MKRTNTYISAALVLLLSLAACNKTEPENTDLNNGQIEDVAGTAIVFTATGLSSNTATAATTSTRATVDGDWENVDSVGVKIGDTVKGYAVTADALDNTKATLSSDDPHYWSTNHDELTVTAWWPYTDGETSMPDVVVKENQSIEDDFKASDFISAEQTVSYSSSTLEFTHRTARVFIKLSSYTDALSSVKLTNLSTEKGNPDEIIPYEYDRNNFTYVALVAPQEVEAGTAFITYEFDDGRTFTYKMQNGVTWEAGKDYTYTVSTPDYTYSEALNTYTVYSATGLLAWNQAVQNDLTLNCTLAADIDLTGVSYTWNLVGDSSNPYTGTFEGGNHTITGLTVNQSSTNYVGLIGYLGEGGKVQNLTLDNVSVTGLMYVGGVVGLNRGTVTACNVSGSVEGYSHVGGVAGENYGTVTSCYHASGTVWGTSSRVGGVVGNNQGTMIACGASGTVSGSGSHVGGVAGRNGGAVTNCSSTGKVSSTYSGNEADAYVGGIVGYNYGTSSTVTGCTASGDVEGSAYRIGGVVGINQGTVTNCSASGNVTGSTTASRRVGGVVGDNQGTTIACYASGNVTGYRFVGGVAGWIAGYTVACYATGSVTGYNSVGGVLGQDFNAVIYACYHASGTITGTNNGVNTGGVIGVHNQSTLYSCYWNNNINVGVYQSQNDATGTPTKIGGSVAWYDAVSSMNSAISTWNGSNDNQCKWQYEYHNEDTPPTLTETN